MKSKQSVLRTRLSCLNFIWHSNFTVHTDAVIQYNSDVTYHFTRFSIPRQLIFYSYENCDINIADGVCNQSDKRAISNNSKNNLHFVENRRLFVLITQKKRYGMKGTRNSNLSVLVLVMCENESVFGGFSDETLPVKRIILPWWCCDKRDTFHTFITIKKIQMTFLF